jgi:tRNA threonylcarbamoyl adenosine modification protein YjeE
MILKGELGVGKTQFVKGIAAKLGVEETIISPTFTIYYEYPVKNNTLYNNLYHFDLYNIEEEEEFKHLGIEELLKAKNLLCFEWGEKSGSIFETFKEKATIVMVEIEYINQKERRIKVQY